LAARNGRRSAPVLILMTDDTRAADWREAAAALPKGSAVVVRHRDARERERLAQTLRAVCAPRRIKLLIADDPRLAVRVRADGVHLPEKRAAHIAGLKAQHPRWFVSAAAHGARSAAAALRAGADAVLIAPAFATASHPRRKALGPLKLAIAARLV